MRPNESFHLAPPWRTKSDWQEANRRIDDRIQQNSGKLSSAAALAASARVRLMSIFDLLDDLCMETCPRCPDPCCLNASPWFDFRDLLFLHLNALPIPFGQPIEAFSATCCYYSPRGCTLARISRPWICTWYLCPVQTANLKKRRAYPSKDLTFAINEIKVFRKEMEETFIRVII